MSKDSDPLNIGIIVNFINSEISNDGIPYFTFALNPTVNPKAQQVFYINLRKDYATEAFTAAIYAWANQSKVEVILDLSLGKMRARKIRPAK